MALVRRRFVGAIIIDAIFLSFIVVSALVHAVSRGHRDAERRGAIAPFLTHIVHALIGLVGIVAIHVPAASTPSRLLVALAPFAFVGDTIASVRQVQLALVTAADTDDALVNEYTVFALLALLLTASSAHVYWSSRAEHATFRHVFAMDEHDA